MALSCSAPPLRRALAWASTLAATVAVAPLSSAATPLTRYPAEARHSPMTPSVVERLSAVMAQGGKRADVFAKLGDSITVNPGFLGCFATPAGVDLGENAALQPTIDFFSRTPAHDEAGPFGGPTLSWNRRSVGAGVGWTSIGLAGTAFTSPVRAEIAATQPAFAVVMTGTNETYPGGVHNYERNLRRLTSEILAEGVVPLLSTFPPRRDNPDLNGIVASMNAVARLVAMTSRVPLMDYWATVVRAPGFGLGLDGIHPQSFAGKPCWLTREALEAGVNARNLVTLEALDRARRFLVMKQTPEPEPPSLAGGGVLGDPRQMDAVPFVDASLVPEGASRIGEYSCDRRGGRGPETVYTFHMDSPARLRADLFAEPDAPLAMYLLASASADACLARGDRTLEAELPAGSYLLVVDARTELRGPRPYGLTLTRR